MKKLLYALTKNKLVEKGVAVFDMLDKEPPNLLRVLTYHRVDKPEDSPHLSPTLLSAPPEQFDRQMAFVCRHYVPVSLQQVLGFVEGKTALPPRALLVTVDDAYSDVERYVWPIAKRYEIPITLFVPTDYPDNPVRSLWWDRLYHALNQTGKQQLHTAYGSFSLVFPKARLKAFKQLSRIIKSLPHHEAMQFADSIDADLAVPACSNNILGWGALRRLAAEGLTLGAHTCSHPMLDRLDPDDVRHEVRVSRIVLQERIGAIAPVFAYPSGQVSESVQQILKEEGYSLAFTTQRGVNDMNQQNPLLLKRINVARSTTLAMLRAQCFASVAKFGVDAIQS